MNFTNKIFNYYISFPLIEQFLTLLKSVNHGLLVHGKRVNLIKMYRKHLRVEEAKLRESELCEPRTNFFNLRKLTKV